MASPRIYITGHMGIEHEGVFVDERELPGRQGRLAFAFLAGNRVRPVGRDELMTVIWRDEPPNEADAALSAILSKLRGTFRRAGVEAAGIDMRTGVITLRLPGDTHVDIEDAANAIDQAEGAWRQRDLGRAWAHANVAVTVGRRPFVAHEEAPWIEAQRTRLRGVLYRGLQVLASTSADNGDLELAVQYASEILAVEPYRETGYQELMRLHTRMGNPAEALRVYGRCRELLRDELGASPSPRTEALFLEILRAREPQAS